MRLSTLCLTIFALSAPIAGHSQARNTLKVAPFDQWQRRFYTVKDGLPGDSVSAIAALPGGVLAASGGKVVRLVQGKWQPQAVGAGVAALASGFKDAMARAGASDGVWALTTAGWKLEPGSPKGVFAFSAEPDGTAWALNAEGAYRCDKAWTFVNETDADVGESRAICALGPETCYIGSDRGLFALMGKRKYWVPLEIAPHTLPSANVRGISRLVGSQLAIVTDKGLTLTDGKRGWLTFQGAQGLPILKLDNVIKVGNVIKSENVIKNGNVTSFDNDALWMGSQRGLTRFVNGQFQYFASMRWLPDDQVNALAPGEGGSVWVATPKGVAHIFAERMTLEQKAARMQRQIDSRNRRFDYVTIMLLRAPGDFTGATQEISDNDGAWTSLYVASQAFRYAVTKDAKAQENAWKSMQALLRLETATGIKGFPARAIANESEADFKARGLDHDKEWHASPTEKGWWWKGETSSDEIDGHYFAWYIFNETAAKPEQKKAVIATCRRVTDHIIDNGYYLIDKDGKPTTWGVWAPEKLNDDPMWFEERGLNSLEILSHLKVAHHLTGDAKYDRAYRELIEKHHYAINAFHTKLEGSVQHDDELAILSYYPLLVLEKDPGLRALYLASLRRFWSLERIEENPFWNFVYGAGTGEDCDPEGAARSLKEIPLDLIRWTMKNSHRADLKLTHDPRRPKEIIPIKPLPWMERPTHKWDRNPYALDDGDGGRVEEDATLWLLPYWMGRFHGFIEG